MFLFEVVFIATLFDFTFECFFREFVMYLLIGIIVIGVVDCFEEELIWCYCRVAIYEFGAKMSSSLLLCPSLLSLKICTFFQVVKSLYFISISISKSLLKIFPLNLQSLNKMSPFRK